MKLLRGLLYSFLVLFSTCTVSNKMSVVTTSDTETYEITVSGSLDFESIITRTDLSSDNIITRSDFYSETGITSPVSSPMPGITNSKQSIAADTDPVFVIAVVEPTSGETIVDENSVILEALYVIGEDSFEFQFSGSIFFSAISPLYQGCLNTDGTTELDCLSFEVVADASGAEVFDAFSDGELDFGTISLNDNESFSSSNTLSESGVVAPRDTTSDAGSSSSSPDLSGDLGFENSDVAMGLYPGLLTIESGTFWTTEGFSVGNVYGTFAENSDRTYYTLDGLSAYATPSQDLDDRGISDEMTLIAWFNSEDISSTQSIVSRWGEETYGANSDTFAFHINDGKLEFTLAGEDGVDDSVLISTTSVQSNTWYFGAVTVNRGSGEASLYMDGDLETTATIPTGSQIPGIDSDQSVVLGADLVNASPVNLLSGKIAGVFFLKRVFTADEILESYDLQNGD
jgi:hypothetical protein